jgi:hypothetical protein
MSGILVEGSLKDLVSFAVSKAYGRLITCAYCRCWTFISRAAHDLRWLVGAWLRGTKVAVSEMDSVRTWGPKPALMTSDLTESLLPRSKPQSNHKQERAPS